MSERILDAAARIGRAAANPAAVIAGNSITTITLAYVVSVGPISIAPAITLSLALTSVVISYALLLAQLIEYRSDERDRSSR